MVKKLSATKKLTVKKSVKAKPSKKEVALAKISKPKAVPKEVLKKEKPQKIAIAPKKSVAKKIATTVVSPAKPKETLVIVKPTVKISPPIPKKIARPKVTLKEPPVLEKPPLPKREIKETAIKEPVIEKAPVTVAPEPTKVLEIDIPITVKDLSTKLQVKPSILIKRLMDLKVMATLNQSLAEDILQKVVGDFGFTLKKLPSEEEQLLEVHLEKDSPEKLKPRWPVVTFMGHVDHGKTSLLDAIRKTKVTEKEYGGITQHIGAYEVNLPKGRITFLDTPGHEAFTAMRARGAKATDIVVLVVAADDGVMPQTVEAIDHARAADVPIIVAINKIDKPQADIEKVKRQLSEQNLLAEDWGGKTITVGVSAKTNAGIDQLLEMILLEAEMLELKANPDRLAFGIVIEAKLTQERGPVSTLMVENGTLRLNDVVLVGAYYGKIRAMFNDRGKHIKEALPATPVEVLGLNGVPQAGEKFYVLNDEKKTKELALRRQESLKQKETAAVKRINLEDLYAQIKEGKIKELNIILKADVQGSLGAIKESLKKIPSTEVKLNVIHEGVGLINTSDVILAEASEAVIIGFHVESDDKAKEEAAKQSVDVRIYNVIYELINDLKAALEGMLEPKIKKVFLGRLEVRKVFKLSKAGTIAGCFVQKGKITRSATLNLVREGKIIYEGKVSSLKHFKDDVREMQEGNECGVSLAGFDDIKEGDILEVYEIEKIARKLEEAKP